MQKNTEELLNTINSETGNSIMYDLYYGHIIPWEHKATRLDEQKELNRKIESEKSYFDGIIPSDDCKRFELFLQLYDNASSYTGLDAFTYGFRFAVRLMADVYMNPLDKPIHGGQS